MERRALNSIDEDNLPIERLVRRDAKGPGLFKGEAARLAKRQALRRKLLASRLRLGGAPRRTLGAGPERLCSGGSPVFSQESSSCLKSTAATLSSLTTARARAAMKPSTVKGPSPRSFSSRPLSSMALP